MLHWHSMIQNSSWHRYSKQLFSLIVWPESPKLMLKWCRVTETPLAITNTTVSNSCECICQQVIVKLRFEMKFSIIMIWVLCFSDEFLQSN